MCILLYGIARMGVATAVGSVGFFLLNDPRCGERGGAQKKVFFGGAKRRNFCHHTLIYESLFGGSFKKRAERVFLALMQPHS